MLLFFISQLLIFLDTDCDHDLCANLHFLLLDFFQDSLEPEILGSESGTDYVWDDSTLPHKLVVRINGSP